MRYFLKIILSLGCIIFFSSQCVFSKESSKTNFKDRDIQIACLAHKTFIEHDYPVKLRHSLEMRSSDPDFGGISAMLLKRDLKQIYFATDRGFLITAHMIRHPKTGIISCFNNAKMRPLRGRSTNPLGGHYADSEGMTFDLNGTDLLISFERHHRAVSYDPTAKILLPKKDYKPFDKKNLPYNESYESILQLADHTVVAFPERYEVQEKVLRGFHMMEDEKTLKNIHLKRHGGFWLTDLAQLSNGDFVTLERSFSVFQGIEIQMRHIPKKIFLSGGVADGKVIFSMKTGDGVDNFEGLDIVPDPSKKGHHFIYMISDNNFLSFQKTLLFSLEYQI